MPLGPFALSRRSVADALPGVAIAISLVPPLGVVGVSLSVGDLAAASGAFLLFGTNLLADPVAGGGLLAVMGYGAVARRVGDVATRRRAAVVTGLALAVVIVPLVATTIRVGRDTLLEERARAITRDWLEGSGYELILATADGDRLTITLDGSGSLPSTANLREAFVKLDPSIRPVLRILAGRRIELAGG